MVVGQTGQLGIVQSYVIVELKIRPEAAVILYHLVEERIVVVKQKNLRCVMQLLA